MANIGGAMPLIACNCNIAAGRPASNAVVVKTLSARDHDRLKTTLGAVAPVENLIPELLFWSRLSRWLMNS